MASGGPTPSDCSYTTSAGADLLGPEFYDFLRKCTSADWKRWSTLERCRVLVIVHVGATIADAGGKEEIIGEYTAAVIHFLQKVECESSIPRLSLHTSDNEYFFSGDGVGYESAIRYTQLGGIRLHRP